MVHSALIERSKDAFQEAVALDQILQICGRAFGPAFDVTSIEELAGGTINNVYRIEAADHQPVILRIAPRPDHPQLFEHDRELLRREFAVQPFLAPVATLIPTVIMADFTHQLIGRDYMFQSYIPGQLWRAIDSDLSAAERTALWRQLGAIARAIHTVGGSTFGIPAPARFFTRWSDAILADFAGIIRDLTHWEIGAEKLHVIAARVAAQPAIFDQIGVPHLLHGDLWTHNLLVQRDANGAVITGVLDAGFAQWGDPAADWTIMHLTITPKPETQPFWETYGPIERDAAATIRTLAYQARSIGYLLLELKRMHYSETSWLWAKLDEIAQALQQDA